VTGAEQQEQTGREEYVQELVRQAARAMGVTPDAIYGPRREQAIVEARWAVIARLYEQGWGLVDIGRALGRDHSSIHHALQRIEPRMRMNEDFRDLIGGLPAFSHVLRTPTTAQLMERLAVLRDEARSIAEQLDARLDDLEGRFRSPLIARAS